MENYILANCTDTGKVRDVNEDSMTTFDSPNGRVVAICDGMGGQNAGDVASQLATSVIQDILQDNAFPTPEEAITKSMLAANRAILHRASIDKNLAGMGATCVMLIIKDGKVYYGSVGDSRIYYVAEGMIRQLTKDQSYVQTLVDAGELSPEAAEHHRDKNQITNALGVEGMTPPVIGKMPIIPEPGSIFILCSDGLSGMVNNNTILGTVTRADLSIQEKATTLVKQANDAGGADNITVQLVEFPGGEGGAVTAPLSQGSNKPLKPTKRKNNTMVYSLMGIVLFVVISLCAVWWFFLRTEPKPTPAPKTNTVKPKPKTNADTTPKVKKIVVEKEVEATDKSPKKESKSKANKIIKTKEADKKAKQKAFDKTINPQSEPPKEQEEDIPIVTTDRGKEKE